MINLAIFASGNGTNALNIIEYFKDHNNINICVVICNKIDAPIVSKSPIPVEICMNGDIESDYLGDMCDKWSIDGIILAGFLRKIPKYLIERYDNKILNIHPSLLPKYGGMYGRKIHESVSINGDDITGITIHYVNEEYDKGVIIAQYETTLEEKTIEEIEYKIHQLEMKYYPIVIENIFNI